MKRELLLLKIHNGLKDGKGHYEATRGNWKLSEKRLESIAYVAGINRGKVECLFQPVRWSVVEEGPEKGRKSFEGIDGPNELLSILQDKGEQLLKKFGTGSPVAYIDINDIEQGVYNKTSAK